MIMWCLILGIYLVSGIPLGWVLRPKSMTLDYAARLGILIIASVISIAVGLCL